MPRYLFHLHNDIHSPDEEGQELSNDQSAMQQALHEIRELASANVKQGHLNLKHFIIVTNDAGREVGIVRFGDAVNILT